MQGFFFYYAGWVPSAWIKRKQKWPQKMSNKKDWAMTTPKNVTWPLKSNQT